MPYPWHIPWPPGIRGLLLHGMCPLSALPGPPPLIQKLSVRAEVRDSWGDNWEEMALPTNCALCSPVASPAPRPVSLLPSP